MWLDDFLADYLHAELTSFLKKHSGIEWNEELLLVSSIISHDLFCCLLVHFIPIFFDVFAFDVFLDFCISLFILLKLAQKESVEALESEAKEKHDKEWDGISVYFISIIISHWPNHERKETHVL